MNDYLPTAGKKTYTYSERWRDATVPERRAGREGERTASADIRSVLRPDDFYYTNLRVFYDGQEAEMDNVVVNRCGVFIIEVKNYTGILAGEADEYEWVEYKDANSRGPYAKNVKNPLPQVRRQAGLLAGYLRYYGPNVWVEGFAYMLNGSSPVDDPHMLLNSNDIDRAIHPSQKTKLTKAVVEEICRLLDD